MGGGGGSCSCLVPRAPMTDGSTKPMSNTVNPKSSELFGPDKALAGGVPDPVTFDLDIQKKLKLGGLMDVLQNMLI